jgi:hypothetical protein
MRLQFGDPAKAEETSRATEDWQIIHSPRARVSYWLAALMGLALSIGLCVGIGLLSWVVNGRNGMSTAGDSAMSWVAVQGNRMRCIFRAEVGDTGSIHFHSSGNYR